MISSEFRHRGSGVLVKTPETEAAPVVPHEPAHFEPMPKHTATKHPGTLSLRKSTGYVSHENQPGGHVRYGQEITEATVVKLKSRRIGLSGTGPRRVI